MRSTDAPVRRPVAAAQVLAVGSGGARRRPDTLVTEEPMEIRVHGPGEPPSPLAVTMRTPGDDFELAAGFLLTEGILGGADDVDRIAYCVGPDGAQEFNVVTVRTRHPVVEGLPVRAFPVSSSCGLCGRASLDGLAARCAPVAGGPVVDAEVVRSLPDRLAGHQHLFGRTGGLHAAARFTPDGRLLAVREDVGRHNALDKLVGHALLTGALPCSSEVLVVSGRLSFEIVQKAAVAGIPVICAVSAPSNLAVAAATRLGQTVVGFLRGERFNVYSHPDRIAVA